MFPYKRDVGVTRISWSDVLTLPKYKDVVQELYTGCDPEDPPEMTPTCIGRMVMRVRGPRQHTDLEATEESMCRWARKQKGRPGIEDRHRKVISLSE